MLDENGLLQQADRIDYYLKKVAQEAAALEPNMDATALETPTLSPAGNISTSIEPPTEITQETHDSLANTTYLMFKELHKLYDRFLPRLDYLGKQNIEIVAGTFDHFMTLFATVLRGRDNDYNAKELDFYRSHIRKAEQELKRSVQMKVTPAKVKIDKFYLYEELEILTRKLQRIYDKGAYPELNPVVKKSRALRDTFANVIKQISEQVANADLIEIS